MPSLTSSALLLAGLWLAPAAASTGTAPAYRNAFIVEAEANHGPLGDSFFGDVSNAVSRLGPGCQARARNSFDSPYFTGASFDLTCDDHLEQAKVLHAIQSLQTVGKAWPVGIVKHQMAVPGGGGARAGLPTVIPPRATNDSAPASADTLSTHLMSHVDQLHAEGVTGAGVKIAVVDSGFDTGTPGLSHTKVTYTHDITTGLSDVGDNCSLHGTHVLGIVGANSGASNLYGVNGVARDATYELYRIQRCNTTGATTDDLIAAFTEAASRGVDIITCSYGGTGGFPEEPWALASSRIFRSGVFVSLPAGNDGPGPFTGSTPATGTDVSATGAADNTVYPCAQWEASLTIGTGAAAKAFPLVPGGQMRFPDRPLTVWSPLEEETDAKPANCSFAPNAVPPDDPANTIALYKGSQCFVDADGTPLETKFNISYIMHYTPKTPAGQPDLCPDVWEADSDAILGIFETNYETGAAVQSALGQGRAVTVQVPSRLVDSPPSSLTNAVNTQTGGLMAYYSSWGPTFDVRSMPTYVAPGHNILSTFPRRIGAWGVIGGTSMATPYAAGVAALLKQRNPHWTPQQIQSVMATTAHPMKWNSRQRTEYFGVTADYLAPVIQQGGGLIDAYAAAYTRTQLNVTNLSFNDTINRVPSISFTLSNTGTEALVYTLGHVGAASGYMLNHTGNAQYNLTGNMGLPVYAELDITPSQVTVSPGNAATISVVLKAEPHLPEGVSYFGGYVAINATALGDGAVVDVLSLPYTGVGGSLTSLPMLDRDRTSAVTLDTSSFQQARAGAGRVYTCAYDAAATIPCTFVPDGLAPGVSVWPVTQSRNLTIDLVSLDTGRVVLDDDGFANSSSQWTRGSFIYWDGTDLNKTYVPPGNYLWRVHAQVLNGEAVETIDTAMWTLKYAANSTFNATQLSRQAARRDLPIPLSV